MDYPYGRGSSDPSLPMNKPSPRKPLDLSKFTDDEIAAIIQRAKEILRERQSKNGAAR